MAPDKRFDTVVNFVLSNQMKKDLQSIANRRQISVAQLLRDIIKRYLEGQE